MINQQTITQNQENILAPDFSLLDLNGHPVNLSDFRDQKHVVLVFNRGFMWPFCRMHMAQLRHDYDKFVTQEAEILVVGPEEQKAFQDYWAKNSLPFIGLPDPEHSVANLYGQQVKLLKLGRMPALMVIDKDGHIRYAHYGNSMQDIPPNQQILGLLTNLNAEEE